MTPACQTGVNDFDFLIGAWCVAHRRLRARLVGCNEWVEFTGSSVAQQMLGGIGNIDDNRLDFPEGAYCAVTLRSYSNATRQWSIWWLDGRHPERLDTALVGHFKNGVGTFYAEDTLDGRPIRVRFLWTMHEPGKPRWAQAFSVDAGATWETNWVMDFSRCEHD